MFCRFSYIKGTKLNAAGMLCAGYTRQSTTISHISPPHGMVSYRFSVELWVGGAAVVVSVELVLLIQQGTVDMRHGFEMI